MEHGDGSLVFLNNEVEVSKDALVDSIAYLRWQTEER